MLSELWSQRLFTATPLCNLAPSLEKSPLWCSSMATSNAFTFQSGGFYGCTHCLQIRPASIGSLGGWRKPWWFQGLVPEGSDTGSHSPDGSRVLTRALGVSVAGPWPACDQHQLSPHMSRHLGAAGD